MSSDRRKFRTITYIDGYNLYFGMLQEAVRRGTKKEPSPRWYRYMWLDLERLSIELLSSTQELVGVRYFTAPITGSKAKQERQNAYLDALRTRPLVEIIPGRFQPDRKECERCGHPAYHPQEKKTDVNIATNLICDALDDRYDTAILISGDSDLVPALSAVKKLAPAKRLVVAFPPNRYSSELEQTTGVDGLRIWETMLRRSRFPEVIEREGLPQVIRPRKYSGEPGCTSAAPIKSKQTAPAATPPKPIPI